MTGHLLDHFVFKSRRWTDRTKRIVFLFVTGSVVLTFLLFRATAWGIRGESERPQETAFAPFRVGLAFVEPELTSRASWLFVSSTGPAGKLVGRKWRKTWNIYD